ncbi:hypothetical protein BC829DRAFT_406215 [Chytridium lagenaria]|nr:hypothetical protein BC829DRAFT_406215 [Chytridium lagenaria]
MRRLMPGRRFRLFLLLKGCCILLWRLRRLLSRVHYRGRRAEEGGSREDRERSMRGRELIFLMKGLSGICRGLTKGMMWRGTGRHQRLLIILGSIDQHM